VEVYTLLSNIPIRVEHHASFDVISLVRVQYNTQHCIHTSAFACQDIQSSQRRTAHAGDDGVSLGCINSLLTFCQGFCSRSRYHDIQDLHLVGFRHDGQQVAQQYKLSLQQGGPQRPGLRERLVGRLCAVVPCTGAMCRVKGRPHSWNRTASLSISPSFKCMWVSFSQGKQATGLRTCLSPPLPSVCGCPSVKQASANRHSLCLSLSLPLSVPLFPPFCPSVSPLCPCLLLHTTHTHTHARMLARKGTQMQGTICKYK
jgi:hypothetical protein